MSISGREIDRAWVKLGMEVKDSNHRHALLYVDGKLILRTKRSFGSKMLDGNIPSLIRQQMKLDQSQFDDLLACPLNRAGYIEILRKKRVI